MRFDWKRFCVENKIEYVTSGPNTSAGNISVHCPWCGNADRSQHMGLSLNRAKPDFGCWRSQSHRGRHPGTLIAKLMGWHLEQANRYVENQGDNLDAFDSAMASLSDSEEQQTPIPKRELKFPPEFRLFDGSFPTTEGRFYLYLRNDRGFGSWTDNLINKFSLRYVVRGEYAGRIIIPVYQKSSLVTWTARAITKAKVRYKSLEADKCVVNIKNTLLATRVLVRKRILVVTEGPFDMMKLAIVGDLYGIQVCCVFGLTISNAQLLQLSILARACGQVIIILDSTATLESAKMCSEIEEVSGVPCRTHKLPEDVKDPGELSQQQVVQLCRII